MFPSVRVTASGLMATNPFSSYKDKVGTLNDSVMTMGGQNFAIGTTMLVSANVQTPNEGLTYTVDYEFEYREDPYDWEAVVVAIDPKTGKPYEGITRTKYSDTTYKPSSGSSGVVDGSLGYSLYRATDLQSLFTP